MDRSLRKQGLRGVSFMKPLFFGFFAKMSKRLDNFKKTCYYMSTERTLGDQGLQGVPFMELPISFLGYSYERIYRLRRANRKT